MSALDRLSRAVDQMSRTLGSAAPDQAHVRTPCAGWTVDDLVAHVVADIGRFTESAHGRRPDFRSTPPPVAGDWRAAFDAHSPGLLAAWRAQDLSKPIRIPIGEVPGDFVVNQQTAEFAVHAWDLATATGQRPEWDEEVATEALNWARGTLKPEFRGDEGSGKAFGHEVDAPAGASPTQRLVAFFGRSPGWTP